MSAWTNLLAASQLAVGSAWALLRNPKTVGAGVVLNNGAAIIISQPPMQVSIDTIGQIVAIDDNSMAVTLAPGITAQINTKPIGATA